jgi:hypothetical protein
LRDVDTLIDDVTGGGFGELLLWRFKEPELRFQQIRVDIDKIDDSTTG